MLTWTFPTAKPVEESAEGFRDTILRQACIPEQTERIPVYAQAIAVVDFCQCSAFQLFGLLEQV
jgi:hypothetical protein